MSNSPAQSEVKSQAFFMLLSAGIFAYFGFTTSWNYTGVNGQFLLFVAMLDWTLKGTAVAFGLSFLLTLLNPVAGSLLNSVSGLISALMFVIVGILDILDTQHTAMSPILLFIFAAWNGYGSWTGLQEVLAHRNRSHDNTHESPHGSPPTSVR